MLLTQGPVEVDWNAVWAFLFSWNYEDDWFRRKWAIWNFLKGAARRNEGHTLASLQNPDKSFAFY